MRESGCLSGPELDCGSVLELDCWSVLDSDGWSVQDSDDWSERESDGAMDVVSAREYQNESHRISPDSYEDINEEAIRSIYSK